MRQCCACGRAQDHSLDERKKRKVELRPYGPGGADICFECAFSTPERQAETERNFEVQLNAASAASPHGVAVISADLPPSPLLLEDP